MQNVYKSVRETAGAGGAAGKTPVHDRTATEAPRTACSEAATKAGRTIWPPVEGTAATGKTAHETAARSRGTDRCSQRRRQADEGHHRGAVLGY